MRNSLMIGTRSGTCGTPRRHLLGMRSAAPGTGCNPWFGIKLATCRIFRPRLRRMKAAASSIRREGLSLSPNRQAFRSWSRVCSGSESLRDATELTLSRSGPSILSSEIDNCRLKSQTLSPSGARPTGWPRSSRRVPHSAESRCLGRTGSCRRQSSARSMDRSTAGRGGSTRRSAPLLAAERACGPPAWRGSRLP